MLPVDAAPTDPAVAIATAALRTLAATAALPAARAALLAAQPSAAPAPTSTPTTGATAAAGQVQLPLLLHDLLRCCVLTRCHAAADAAIVCVGQLAADAALQVGHWAGTARARVRDVRAACLQCTEVLEASNRYQ